MGVISNLLVGAYAYADEEELDKTKDQLDGNVRDSYKSHKNMHSNDYSLDEGATYFQTFTHRYSNNRKKGQSQKRIFNAKKSFNSNADVEEGGRSVQGKGYWVNEDGAVEFVRD